MQNDGPTPVEIADSIMGYLDGMYDETLDRRLSTSTMGNNVFITATAADGTFTEFLAVVRPHNHG